MKIDILLLGLFMAGLSYPGHCGGLVDCEARLQIVADHFRNPSSRIAGVHLETRVSVSSQVPDGLDAYADSRSNRVYVSPRVCRYGDMSKIVLIAHEVGHLVAHARLPRLKLDAYSRTPQIGGAIHEGVADGYARDMLRQISTLDFVIDAMRAVCAAESSGEYGFDTRYGSSACAHLGGLTSAGEHAIGGR